MRVRHADKKLERLETDASYRADFSRDVVRAYRKVMTIVRSALDERAFYGLKSLRYEKLKGKRQHQRSMHLNDQFRLILEMRDETGRTVIVVSVEDYH